MRYMYMVHVDRELLGTLSANELEQLDGANEEFDRALKASGHLIMSLALAPPETATLFRLRHGRLSMTDGPYVETKEHLGGFVLINAATAEEALTIARRDPMARYGTIEVRAELGLDWQQPGAI